MSGEESPQDSPCPTRARRHLVVKVGLRIPGKHRCRVDSRGPAPAPGFAETGAPHRGLCWLGGWGRPRAESGACTVGDARETQRVTACQVNSWAESAAESPERG